MMIGAFSPVMLVLVLVLLVLSHAAPALHRHESWSIFPDGVVEGTGAIGMPQKGEKRALIRHVPKNRSMIPLQKGLIRRERNLSKASKPGLQTLPDNSDQRIKGLLQRMAHERRQLQKAHDQMEKLRAASLSEESARDKLVRKAQATPTPVAEVCVPRATKTNMDGWYDDRNANEDDCTWQCTDGKVNDIKNNIWCVFSIFSTKQSGMCELFDCIPGSTDEAVTCAAISPCEDCIKTYPKSGADSGKICVWSPSQHACLPYEDGTGKMQFADVVHGVHGYPGGSSCADAKVSCSVFSCIGAVNKGPSVKCGKDLASCNAKTCCEANPIATTVDQGLLDQDKVTQVFTMKGLDYDKVTQDETGSLIETVKSGFIDVIKLGVLDNLPGYTATDLEVVLSKGSVVAEVTITPMAGSTAEELAAGLQAHGQESTSVMARVKAMPSVESLLESGKTLDDLTVTHTVRAGAPEEVIYTTAKASTTTTLLPTPSPGGANGGGEKGGPASAGGANGADEKGGSKSSSSDGTSPSPSPSASLSPGSPGSPSPTPSPSPVVATGAGKKGGSKLGLGIGIGICIGALVTCLVTGGAWWGSRHYHIRRNGISGVWMDADDLPEADATLEASEALRQSLDALESDLLPVPLDVATMQSSTSFTIGTSDSFVIS